MYVMVYEVSPEKKCVEGELQISEVFETKKQPSEKKKGDLKKRIENKK